MKNTLSTLTRRGLIGLACAIVLSHLTFAPMALAAQDPMSKSVHEPTSQTVGDGLAGDLTDSLSGNKADLPIHVIDSEKAVGNAQLDMSASSFTTYWTWRANGVHQAVRFNHPAITANSRVFVAISEFNSDAQINRFIGAARMAVYNVAPFNGGFYAWVEVSWDYPINVRFDVLVDP